MSPYNGKNDTSLKQEPIEDCLECKLIGTGAMLSISGYFLYLARSAQFANAPSAVRSFNITMSVTFAFSALGRFFLDDFRRWAHDPDQE